LLSSFFGVYRKRVSPELNAKLLEIDQTNVAMYDAIFGNGTKHGGRTYLQTPPPLIRSRPIRCSPPKPRCRPLERKPPDTPEHVKYEQETTLAQARWLRTVFEL